jgi:hypothetical protein
LKKLITSSIVVSFASSLSMIIYRLSNLIFFHICLVCVGLKTVIKNIKMGLISCSKQPTCDIISTRCTGPGRWFTQAADRHQSFAQRTSAFAGTFCQGLAPSWCKSNNKTFLFTWFTVAIVIWLPMESDSSWRFLASLVNQKSMPFC